MVELYYDSRFTGDRVDDAISRVNITPDSSEPSLIIINSSKSSSYYEPISKIEFENKIIIDSKLSNNSNNLVQNKVITKALNTKVSDPINPGGVGQFLAFKNNQTEWVNFPKGLDGKSAYEIWLENGNQGTEEEFISSLKGATGERGETGDKGDTGDAGKNGETGDKGDKGAKGDTGAKGATGLTGASPGVVKNIYYEEITNSSEGYVGRLIFIFQNGGGLSIYTTK